jgi:signal transduction histidine kinase
VQLKLPAGGMVESLSEQKRMPLSSDRPGRDETLLAVVVVGVLLAIVTVIGPFAGIDLGGGPPALAAYATAVLITDVMTAVLLLSIHAARPSRAILVLSLGYLFTGLAAVPWVLTFPGVFSQTGLLGAGLQTTAVIAAGRRVVFPFAILAYALLSRAESGRRSVEGWPGVLAGIVLAIAAVAALTWIALAGGESLPLMRDQRVAAAAWSAVPAVAAVICVGALGLLWWRGIQCSLDLWLIVVLATQLIEIAMLAWVSSGERFTLAWWCGRAVGFVSASVVLVVLMFETMSVFDRLLRAARAERQMREARLAGLQALVGAIAHEVNQPLASIVSNAGAALRWVDRAEPDLDEGRAALERISAEGHRAADVIDGIRTLLRSGVRTRGAVDVNGLVEESLAAIEEEARLARVSVHAALAERLPPISGDRGQLRQALLNLVANAIDAMRTVAGERRLTVGTVAKGSTLLIRIGDTGVGIAPAEAERVFEPFFTTKGDGIGLGLMIARSAVHAHGGTLEIQPAPGKGTVFEIALPVRVDEQALPEIATGMTRTPA